MWLPAVDLGPPIDSEKWFLVVSVSFSLSLEIKVREMAVFLAAAVDGLGHCAMVLWGRQQRRFDVVLDTVSSAGRALTVALAFCFLSIHHLYSRGQHCSFPLNLCFGVTGKNSFPLINVTSLIVHSTPPTRTATPMHCWLWAIYQDFSSECIWCDLDSPREWTCAFNCMFWPSSDFLFRR